MFRTVCYSISAAVLLILLASCPAPFKAEQLKLLQDTDSPGIVIISPSDYSEYSTVISLKCAVTDQSMDVAADQNPVTVSYEIPGTTLSGRLEKNTDGTFSAAINASTLDGSHTIKVTATDINGNISYGVVNIVKPASGGDISGFKVTPSSNQVTIAWDPVPFAESYTIYEYSYGKMKEDVESPYVWDGLSNGDVYSFRVMADIPDSIGDDAYSATVKSLPLSTRTFAPRIKRTGYRSVTIEWWDDTNISAEYRVERSPSSTGPWQVKRSLTSNEFTDTDVEHNEEYWYRVYLPDYPEIVSSPVSGIPARFKPLGDVQPSITSTSTGSYDWSVAVGGDYAYIGDAYFLGVENGYKGLVIADISDPDNPEILGSASTGSSINGLAVDGSYVYAAVSGDGLVIFDVSNKSDPFVAGTYDTDGSAYDVVVAGNYAYIADDSNGLVVVDVSDPVSPSFAGSYDTPGSSHGVAADGNYAYVADGTNGMVVLDVSDPSDISLEYTFGASDYDSDSDGISADDVCVKGSYAYITGGDEGLVIADVSIPSNVSKAGAVIDSISDPKGLAVGNDYAYVANSTGLVVVDISDPASLVLIDTVLYTASDPYDVSVSGSYAFIADNNQGFVTIDVGVQDKAEEAASVSEVSSSVGIAVAGGYAFVTDYGGGGGTAKLNVLSVSSPESPSLTETITGLADYAHKVRVTGFYAYVAAGNYGMTIVDVSNPLSPSEIADTHVLGTSENIVDVAISGSYAYAADSTNGFVIFDISDPENPSETGSVDYSSGDIPKGIAVSGNYVFVVSKPSATDTGILDIYDVSDPQLPSRTAHITDGLGSDIAYGIDVDGSYAYIADGSGGLVIYDVSDPDNPISSAAGSFPLTDSRSVSVHGKYAYVADGSGGLVILDVSDPSAPDRVDTGSAAVGTDVRDVAVSGNYVFAADYSEGFVVIRLWEDM